MSDGTQTGWLPEAPRDETPIETGGAVLVMRLTPDEVGFLSARADTLQEAVRDAVRVLRESPFFGADDDAVTLEQWAGMLVLHAEAVHGCDHTEQVREALGMDGPRGEPVS